MCFLRENSFRVILNVEQDKLHDYAYVRESSYILLRYFSLHISTHISDTFCWFDINHIPSI